MSEPLEAALSRAYYYNEDGTWRDCEDGDFTRWLAVAKVAARDAEPLLREALEALEYHTAQTRPIQRTADAIKALRARLEPLPPPPGGAQ